MRKSFITRAVSSNPLFFIFAIPLLTDSYFTLFGQSAEYWHDYQRANEASPTFFILIFGPVVFILFACLWIIILYALVRWLKAPFNLMFALVLFAYHTNGSASWLNLELKRWSASLPSHRIALLFSWGTVLGYFALIGACAAWSIFIYFRDRQPAQLEGRTPRDGNV